MNRTRTAYSMAKFPRTMGEAFKDATYASPLTRPYPPLWRRVLQAVKEILS